MRVTYDYQAFVTLKKGGIPRYFCELLKQQRREPSVAANVFLGLYINDYMAEEMRTHPAGQWKLRVPHIRGLWRINKMLWNLWVMGRQSDIYHATYYDILKKPRGAVKVVTVYDFIPERFYPDDRRSAFYIRQKHAGIRTADFILCISRQTQRDLAHFCGVPEEKSRVIYLGASELFAPHFGPREPVILFVGTRFGYKNYRALRVAYETDRDLHTTHEMVCFGGPRPAAHDIPRHGKFRHVAGDDSLLSEYYRNARILVYPSLYEGFGLPIIEALASGCPVLTTRGGSIAEIGLEHVHYFDPADPTSLGRELRRVLGESIDPLQQANAANYAKQFSWERCWLETKAAYEEALGKC